MDSGFAEVKLPILGQASNFDSYPTRWFDIIRILQALEHHILFFLEIGCILCADVYSRNTHLEHFGTTSRDIPAKNINTRQSYTENTAINQMLACQKKVRAHFATFVQKRLHCREKGHFPSPRIT